MLDGFFTVSISNKLSAFILRVDSDCVDGDFWSLEVNGCISVSSAYGLCSSSFFD